MYMIFICSSTMSDSNNRWCIRTFDCIACTYDLSESKWIKTLFICCLFFFYLNTKTTHIAKVRSFIRNVGEKSFGTRSVQTKQRERERGREKFTRQYWVPFCLLIVDFARVQNSHSLFFIIITNKVQL